MAPPAILRAEHPQHRGRLVARRPSGPHAGSFEAPHGPNRRTLRGPGRRPARRPTKRNPGADSPPCPRCRACGHLGFPDPSVRLVYWHTWTRPARRFRCNRRTCQQLCDGADVPRREPAVAPYSCMALRTAVASELCLISSRRPPSHPTMAKMMATTTDAIPVHPGKTATNSRIFVALEAQIQAATKPSHSSSSISVSERPQALASLPETSVCDATGAAGIVVAGSLGRVYD